MHLKLTTKGVRLQARAVGDELVVGLVPDREILRCKGPPVQNQQERKIMVEAVKWVGQVIEGEHCAFAVDDQSATVGRTLSSALCMYECLPRYVC